MRRLFRASIRTQIAVLAATLIVLVSIVAAISEPFIYGRHDKGIQIGLFAGRAETIFDQYRNAETVHEEDAALDRAERSGMRVERASAEQLAKAGPVPADVAGPVRALLEDNFFTTLRHLFDERPRPDTLVVPAGSGRGLVFHLPVFPRYLWFAPAVASGLLKILVPLALLAYFSSWLIVHPLVRFATAAERASMDDTLEQPFSAEGSAEIRSLAGSLNVMRGRVLELMGARTRMLTSISHDLRTPLTRLRMRAERCGQPDLRQQMLKDIETLVAMVDESLAFLNNAIEEERKVELSSLLQTIATDFADMGMDVSFRGPRRVIYTCKPRAISRAISNLIDNASRFATKIEIELQTAADGTILIIVSDNGPGLTDKLKLQVLQPFFKADQARPVTRRGGFGLGLPTAHGIITKGHGGTFRLADREPHGLVAEISLPPLGQDRPKPPMFS